jgi:hypothetical protein
MKNWTGQIFKVDNFRQIKKCIQVNECDGQLNHV